MFVENYRLDTLVGGQAQTVLKLHFSAETSQDLIFLGLPLPPATINKCLIRNEETLRLSNGFPRPRILG
jgi:hypothetical protein